MTMARAGSSFHFSRDAIGIVSSDWLAALRRVPGLRAFAKGQFDSGSLIEDRCEGSAVRLRMISLAGNSLRVTRGDIRSGRPARQTRRRNPAEGHHFFSANAAYEPRGRKP